jgi:hypothetical protein
MKLIIDMDEEVYKRCCFIADLDGSPILKTIKNSIPLDNIRAELHATAEFHEDGDCYLRDEWIDEIFDEYMAK